MSDGLSDSKNLLLDRQMITKRDDMKCPGNENHRGVKFVLAPITSDHKANMLCKECGAWIKNVSLIDMEAIKSSDSDEVDEAAEIQETDVERMQRCVGDAYDIYKITFNLTHRTSDVAILSIAFKLYDGSGSCGG